MNLDGFFGRLLTMTIFMGSGRNRFDNDIPQLVQQMIALRDLHSYTL